MGTLSDCNVYACVTGVIVRGDGALETDDPSAWYLAVANGKIALTARVA